MSRSAIITGASSGIGEKLAMELAARGYSLGLTARRRTQLDEVAAAIRAAHPGRMVAVAEHDVSVFASTASVLERLAAELGGLDVVVVNAGVGNSGRVGEGELDRARMVVEVNLIGAIATVDAAVSLMRKTPGRRGHIVGISSVAGFRGRPGSAAYSASKAGLSTYLDAVRGEVHRDGIVVTDIRPGLIDTAINQRYKSRPFLISGEDGARRIAKVIERRSLSAIVPWWPWAIIGWVMRRCPERLWLRLTATKRESA